MTATTIARMELGIGIGADLGLSEAERTTLASEAAGLGYASAWTNARGPDAIDASERWFDACGIATGTSVVPTPSVDLAALATRARGLGARSGARFVLGVGVGQISDPAFRAKHGIAPEVTPVALMRGHLAALRPAAGVPVYLAALGPAMLRLAGAAADGAMPNWMDPSQLAWARRRIAEGARAAGRDPAAIRLVQGIRVSVDEDERVARSALAKVAFGYALARPNQPRGGSYRALMARMGLDDDLARLEALRAKGASDDELVEACPDRVLDRLGAYGRPARALAAARRLAEGLDLAIIRVVCARPGIGAARAVLEACAPLRGGDADGGPQSGSGDPLSETG
ncbi:MAG: LLM class flavin-dependent oxidoreductase [Candidatus Limnocylindria bacterium]|nr:LLM class flavin-dependent oxidoreductase [Candidatus Limnocylindria bacterium]